MLVLLPTEHLKALMVSCSKEETRYYLQGVFIDPTGFAVTTDGHRMTIVALKEKPDFAGNDNGIIVPRLAIEKLLKLVTDKYDTSPISIRFNGQEGAISHGDASIAFKPVDGTYPTWRRVMPAKDAEEAPAHFNPAYLADVEKQAKLLGGSFSVKQTGAAPAEIWFNGDDNVRAILMPMRGGGQGSPVTDWVSEKTIKEELAEAA